MTPKTDKEALKKALRQRTDQQRKSIELYCRWIAETLNLHGLDMRKALRHDIEIPWEQSSVKKFIFKAVAKAQFGVISTTELDKGQVSMVYDTINRHFADKFPDLPHIPFPSESELIAAQEETKLLQDKGTSLTGN